MLLIRVLQLELLGDLADPVRQRLGPRQVAKDDLGESHGCLPFGMPRTLFPVHDSILPPGPAAWLMEINGERQPRG